MDTLCRTGLSGTRFAEEAANRYQRQDPTADCAPHSLRATSRRKFRAAVYLMPYDLMPYDAPETAAHSDWAYIVSEAFGIGHKHQRHRPVRRLGPRSFFNARA